MSGRSEYRAVDGALIGIVWMTFAATLIAVGLIEFVTAETPKALVISFVVWIVGLIVTGIWVEWWSR